MGNRSGHTPEGMEEEFVGSQDPRRIIVLEEEEEEEFIGSQDTRRIIVLEEEEEEEEEEKKKKNCFVIGLMSLFCSF
jgi:Trm5-related predicted tRNA methylase